MKIFDELLSQNVNREAEFWRDEFQLKDWWQSQFKASLKFELELDQAIFIAFNSPNFAASFISGYQFALRHKFGDLIAGDELACLCVSESKGNSPKYIDASLLKHNNDLLITAEKSFVTCASDVSVLLVLLDDKRTELNGGDQKHLRLALIKNVKAQLAAQPDNIAIEITKPSSFIPEIDKGKLVLTQFKISESDVLEGDGHQEHSKSFSVLEGLYIRLATLCYLLRLSFYFSWPESLSANIASQILNIRSLLLGPVNVPQTQILLDGCAQAFDACLPEIESLVKVCPAEFIELWERDKITMFMDAGLRKGRLERSWAHYSSLQP